MPVYFQKEWYTVQDVRQHPQRQYVFGDNFVREGKKGQAIIRDEPNAIGVRTKYLPSMKDNAFFSDREYDMLTAAIDDDFVPIYKSLIEGRLVIFPADGLGTGLADLPNKAPKVFAHLQENIEIAKAIDGVAYVIISGRK